LKLAVALRVGTLRSESTNVRNRARNRSPRRETAYTSWVLEDLLRKAPKDHFTLGWAMSTLRHRSFGVVILFLGVLATVPIGSSLHGIVLAAVAVQMLAGSREPVFSLI
jgi:hypothetical protein